MPLFTIANMTTVIIVSYSSSTNTAAAISPPYTSSTSIKPYQKYYYNKYHEGILEIAKGFVNSHDKPASRKDNGCGSKKKKKKTENKVIIFVFQS